MIYSVILKFIAYDCVVLKFTLYCVCMYNIYHYIEQKHMYTSIDHLLMPQNTNTNSDPRLSHHKSFTLLTQATRLQRLSSIDALETHQNVYPQFLSKGNSNRNSKDSSQGEGLVGQINQGQMWEINNNRQIGNNREQSVIRESRQVFRKDESKKALKQYKEDQGNKYSLVQNGKGQVEQNISLADKQPIKTKIQYSNKKSLQNIIQSNLNQNCLKTSKDIQTAHTIRDAPQSPPSSIQHIKSQEQLPIFSPCIQSIPFSVPSQKGSDSSNRSRPNANSENSSIQKIINDFSKKIDTLNHIQVLTPQYNHNNSGHPQSQKTKKSLQSLPLDSFQHQNHYRLYSQQDSKEDYRESQRERQEIWQQDVMELKQDFFYQLKQRNFMEIEEERQMLYPYALSRNKSREMLHLNDQNKKLAETVMILQRELSISEQRIQFLQKSHYQYETELGSKNKRNYQLSQQNTQLKKSVARYKQFAGRKQAQDAQTRAQIQKLKHQLQISFKQLQYKQNCLQQLVKTLKDRQDDNKDLLTYIQSSKQQAQCNIQRYQQKVNLAYRQIQKLQQRVQYYHRRFQESGITLNFSQAEELRNIIEEKDAQTQARIVVIQQNYQKELKVHEGSVSKLQQEKIRLERVVENFRGKQAQFSELLGQYDKELQSRDEEILRLKGKVGDQHKKMQTLGLSNPQLLNNLSLADIMQGRTQSFSASLQKGRVNYTLMKMEKALKLAQQQVQWQRAQKRKVVDQLNQLSQGYQQYMQDFSLYLSMAASTGKAKPNKVRQSQPVKRQIISPGQSSRQQPFALELKQVSRQRKQLATDRPMLYSNRNSYATPNRSQIREKDTKNELNTIQVVLSKASQLSYQYKCRLSLSLIQFGLSLSQKFKKLPALNMNCLIVTQIQGKISITLKQQQGKQAKVSSKALLYKAPQVLLGFSQIQSSYVWTIAIIIDALFHDSLFYKKLSEVTSIKNNYYCRDQTLKFSFILKELLTKNQKMRPNLKWVLREFTKQIV